MDFSKCEQQIYDKSIVLYEHKSKIIFCNKKNLLVRKIKVDNCVIKDGLRCDYLLIDINNCEHFIELKGCDLKHAIEQIKTTINKISQNPQKHTKFCYIICTRCPLISSEIQILKKIFINKYSAKLFVKNICSETIKINE